MSNIEALNGSVLLNETTHRAGAGPAVEMIYPGADRLIEITIIGSTRTPAKDVIEVFHSLAKGDG